MTIDFKFGAMGRLQLELPDGALVASLNGPNAVESNVTAATKAAWEAPLEFPPLRQAIVPGDHVVVALGPGVAQGAEVVAAVVPLLCEAGVECGDITVLRTAADADAGGPDPRRKLLAEHSSVHLATHNPSDQDELGFLAADEHGDPIYLNRCLCDADLVIPVGCLRPDHPEHANETRHNGKTGLWNDTLYPTFADSKTMKRFAQNGVPLTAGQAAQRRKQVDHLAWLLGIQATIQVVPASGDAALRVLAGSPEAVFQAGRELCRSRWQPEISQRAKLVIAGISGGRWQQTWENVHRALEAALELVEEGGAIVVCTELDAQPGTALKHLAEFAETESSQARLRKDRSADAPLARLLVDAQDRATIYLLSQLDEDAVTSLGLAYVARPEEINRLASHYESCIFLADAQFVRPTVTTERAG
jgi:lactate racemase